MSSFLSIGDTVLYGKFKNALGRIVAFGSNDKGDPTIDVQPINKDGTEKKGPPKTLTLLKVRKVEKKAMQSTKNVVAKFLMAKGVAMGETWENGKVRIHRYRPSFFIWDLTNAGRRGKRVETLAVLPRNADDSWMEEQSRMLILNARTFDTLKAYLKKLEAEEPGAFDLSESQERGIDVIPGGVKKMTLNWKVDDEILSLKATPLEFLVSSSKPLSGTTMRQDTLYWQVKKSDANLFYAWLADNESDVQSLGIVGLKEVWHKLGVKFDSH
jgi:hypothetical protein